MLNHGAHVLFVTRSWPPVALDGPNRGDYVVGGKARIAPLLSKYGRVRISIVVRAHAGERFAVQRDVHGPHKSTRDDYVEVVQKANIAGPIVNVLPNYRGVRRLAISFRPLLGRHDEDRFMRKVSYKPSHTQRTGGARGSWVARYSGSPETMVVEAGRAVGGRQLSFLLREPFRKTIKPELLAADASWAVGGLRPLFQLLGLFQWFDTVGILSESPSWFLCRRRLWRDIGSND